MVEHEPELGSLDDAFDVASRMSSLSIAESVEEQVEQFVGVLCEKLLVCQFLLAEEPPSFLR